LYNLVYYFKQNPRSELKILNTEGYLNVSDWFNTNDIISLFGILEKDGESFGTKNDFWQTYSCKIEKYPISVRNRIFEFVSKLEDLNGSKFKFEYGLLTVNNYNPEQINLKYSQNYHFDYDSAKVYKIFIFINKLGIEDGPFQYFSIPDSKKFKFDNLLSYGIPDNLILRKHSKNPYLLLNDSDDVAAFVINTRDCLHCGARQLFGGHRKMLTLTFTDK
jgi:hypothetical protein